MEEILADSDNEFEENLKNEKSTRKKRTSRKEAWIQENEEIIDLIDPAAARNISSKFRYFLKFKLLNIGVKSIK